MLDSNWFIAAVIFVVFSIWQYIFRYNYWSKRNLRGPRPWPFVGNFVQRLRSRPNVFEMDMMSKFGKVYGIYYGNNPALTVIDPELIKVILIKDFLFFPNRRSAHVFHEIWSRNLFQMTSTDWKRVRLITAPIFTSKKLRSMGPMMDKCSEKLENYFAKSLDQKHSFEFNSKKIFTGFTIDVIASTGFATETNTNNVEDRQPENNAFIKNGARLFQVSWFTSIGFFMLPRWLNDLLGIHFIFDNKSFKFFQKLLEEILRKRKMNKNKNTNHDLIQLLIDAYADENDLYSKNLINDLEIKDNEEKIQNDTDVDSSRKKVLSKNEIIAQSMLFFIAGFETTSSTLTYLIYELAMNMDVQEKLYQELKQFSIENKPNDECYYEKLLNENPYLKAVINETLRKYPPAIRLERVLVKDDYKLSNIPLTKNLIVEIPVYAVHHCPEYYPDPGRFNPERFLPENKHLLVPYTFLPFGIGPRNCLGMRFAYQEIKICLAKILLKYRFLPCDETPEKLVFEKSIPFHLVSVLPMKIEKR